jgi:hypothetical protein
MIAMPMALFSFMPQQARISRASGAWQVSHRIPFQQIYLIISEHKCEGQSKKTETSASPVLVIGGSATAFSAFKVFAIKNFSSERHFLVTLFCCSISTG